MTPDIYQEKGYENRNHYLQCMAKDYGVPYDHVLALADLFGEGEDFDGLVTSLDDC